MENTDKGSNSPDIHVLLISALSTVCHRAFNFNKYVNITGDLEFSLDSETKYTVQLNEQIQANLDSILVKVDPEFEYDQDVDSISSVYEHQEEITDHSGSFHTIQQPVSPSHALDISQTDVISEYSNRSMSTLDDQMHSLNGQGNKSDIDNDSNENPSASAGTSIPTYRCTTCNTDFTDYTAFLHHMTNHTKSAEPLSLNGPIFEDIRKGAAIKKKLDEAALNCEVCGKHFASVRDKSMCAHDSEKPYRCSVCSKTFTELKPCRSHMLMHDKQCLCKFCGKSLVDSKSLKNHELIHTGEKPYSCAFCDKTFVQKPQCDYHQRTHTGEKPYQCTTCGKDFSSSHQLTLHTMLHRPYA